MKKSFSIQTTMTVATGKVGAIQITTPANSSVHLNPVELLVSAGPVISSILEDYSFALGAVLTPIDMNRKLSAVSVVAVKALADIVAVAGAAALTLKTLNIPAGAVIETLKLGSSTIMLKAGTTYLITFSNTNAGNALINFDLSWEE